MTILSGSCHPSISAVEVKTMSKYYSVQMTAIYGTPAHHLPNCRAILEFSEPQGNEQAVKDKAGYIT
jgi:hypothetical protein